MAKLGINKIESLIKQLESAKDRLNVILMTTEDMHIHAISLGIQMAVAMHAIYEFNQFIKNEIKSFLVDKKDSFNINQN